ncbi:MAG TPA: hypothetical protein VK171_15990 [Fimbriimonas sp.]|nr:hypothetical protein [Fimbriimonas sp.]
MSIRNMLRKAAELVVELPEAPASDLSDPIADTYVAPETPVRTATKSVAQIAMETPGPSLDQVAIKAEKEEAPLAPGGVVDFAAVYSRAGLTPVPFSAEQALEVISSLPADLPLAVKRSTVQATLSAMGKAMGVDTASVLADAGRKLAALSAYEDNLNHQAEQYVGTLDAQIADLEKQIANHKLAIERAKQLLATAVEKCGAEANRLDDVLEFFTLDQSPSSNA